VRDEVLQPKISLSVMGEDREQVLKPAGKKIYPNAYDQKSYNNIETFHILL